MANARFYQNGYGQFEPQNCAFMRDGRIEAQCKAGSAFTTVLPLENGMLVAVDKPKGEVDLADTTEVRPIGIVYTAEKIYDQFHQGLNQYKVKGGKMAAVLLVEQGNTFTTNTICYDTEEFANDEAVKKAFKDLATTPLACIPSTVVGSEGILQLTKKTEGAPFTAVEYKVMPDMFNYGVKVMKNAVAM